jgi:hypothetical protein
MLERISTCEASLLAGVHANRGALACSLALAFPHGHPSCVSRGIDVEAVLAGLRHGERLVRRVDFINFATVEFADMHIQRALV